MLLMKCLLVFTGMGLEMDLFDNFDMHPEDMNIEVVEMN